MSPGPARLGSHAWLPVGAVPGPLTLNPERTLDYAIRPMVETYMPPMMADVMTPATLGPMA